MWANPAVAGLTPIAVHAENLVGRREPFGDDGFVNFSAATAPQTLIRPAMDIAVVVDVVDRQELRLSLTATSTSVTAVGRIYRVFETLIALSLRFAMTLQVLEPPFAHPFRSHSRISRIPPLLCSLHPIRVGDLPFAILLRDPGLVPRPIFGLLGLTARVTPSEIASLALVEPELMFWPIYSAFRASFHQKPRLAADCLVITSLQLQQDVPAIHGVIFLAVTGQGALS